MIKLWFAPRTRAVRVRWLLEELGLPHELVRVDFNRPSHTFAQSTPLGKLPVVEDDGRLADAHLARAHRLVDARTRAHLAVVPQDDAAQFRARA